MNDITYVSGCQNIKNINNDIKSKLDKLMSVHCHIVISDVSKADRLMQKYLASKKYSRVCVYYSGNVCCHNLGHWQTKRILTSRSRNLSATKDQAMTSIADYGFFVWDGKSLAARRNIDDMLTQGKNVFVIQAGSQSWLRSPQ